MMQTLKPYDARGDLVLEYRLTIVRSNVLRFIAYILYFFRLLPRRYRAKMDGIILFSKRKLLWNERGFWHVAPMPSVEDLNTYYNKEYWVQRDDKECFLIPRDMDHYLLLRPHIEAMVQSFRPRRVLNFGAGHGGLSYILYFLGFDVWNVEASGMPDYFPPKRWHIVDAIDKAEGTFDFIYGSHSMEHVHDIDTFLTTVNEKISPEGLVFFEVPNCRRTKGLYPICGGQNHQIEPPHTYYFTLDFFKKLPYQPIILATYSQATSPHLQAKGEDGEVIRYLATASRI